MPNCVKKKSTAYGLTPLSVLWRKIDLLELLRGYGTARGHYRHLATPEQAYFAGF
jgi:hypothetical protein